MENQIERKMENEMEPVIYIGGPMGCSLNSLKGLIGELYRWVLQVLLSWILGVCTIAHVPKP